MDVKNLFLKFFERQNHVSFTFIVRSDLMISRQVNLECKPAAGITSKEETCKAKIHYGDNKLT